MACYETDGSRLIGKAEKVFFPKNKEDVQRIVKNINGDIVPRGSGTNLVGGCIPNNSFVIDLSKMNKIREFNSKKRTVYAEAGISIKELNEKLNSVGFEFPIEAFNPASTIGGMIARNETGKRSRKYGALKDWIEGIEFVNGNGELIKLNKNDLMDVCGMEGITGIIIGAVLRIMPKFKRSFSLFKTDNINEILSVSRRLKNEADVSMIEFFSPETAKLLGLEEKYHIIIEFDSDRGKIGAEESEEISRLKNKVHYSVAGEGYYNSENFKLFFDKLKEVIIFLNANKVPYFGFADSGIIIPFFKDEEKKKKDETINLIKKIGAKSGGYGIGITRKYIVDSFEKKLIQRIKQRHDPLGKLNKGKLIDEFPYEKLERELKTPEKKMEEFIEAMKKEEKPQQMEIELEKSPEKAIEIEIKERLKDYEFTFESELEKEKMKKIEEIAKKIPKEITRAEIREERVGEEISFEPVKKRVSDDEKDLINKIMTNKFSKTTEIENKKDKEEDKNGNWDR